MVSVWLLLFKRDEFLKSKCSVCTNNNFESKYTYTKKTFDILLFDTIFLTNTQTVEQQAQTEPQEMLEHWKSKLEEFFSLDLFLCLGEWEWMLGTTSLEVYSSAMDIIKKIDISEFFGSRGKQKTCERPRFSPEIKKW